MANLRALAGIAPLAASLILSGCGLGDALGEAMGPSIERNVIADFGYINQQLAPMRADADAAHSECFTTSGSQGVMSFVFRGSAASVPPICLTVSILDQAGKEVARGGGVLGVDWTPLEHRNPEAVPADQSDYALTPVLKLDAQAWSEYRVIIEVSDSVPGDPTELTPTFLVCWPLPEGSGGPSGENPPTASTAPSQHYDDLGH